MKRLEIIGNRSIQEDLMDLLYKRGAAKHYTVIPLVQGVGSSEPKKADSVWPQGNFLLIIFAEGGEADTIVEAARELKSIFPDEGIKVFETDARVLA